MEINDEFEFNFSSKSQSKLSGAGDSSLQTIFDSLRKIVRGLRVSSRAAEKILGLSGAQLFVLQILGENDNISVNDLAYKTHTHQSSVSVVVSRLVVQKLVHRKISRQDARRSIITLTAKGRQVLSQAPSTAQENMVGAILSLPLPQKSQLAKLLKHVVQNSGLADEPATFFFEEDHRNSRNNK